MANELTHNLYTRVPNCEKLILNFNLLLSFWGRTTVAVLLQVEWIVQGTCNNLCMYKLYVQNMPTNCDRNMNLHTNGEQRACQKLFWQINNVERHLGLRKTHIQVANKNHSMRYLWVEVTPGTSLPSFFPIQQLLLGNNSELDLIRFHRDWAHPKIQSSNCKI